MRPEGRKGGGVAIFIKKEIEFKQNNISTSTFESVFLELSGSIKKYKNVIGYLSSTWLRFVSV